MQNHHKSEHIRNVYEEGELAPEPTLRNFRIVQSEGKRQVERDVAHYNLDVVISVGYRVKSHRGVQFHGRDFQWVEGTCRRQQTIGTTISIK